MVLYGRKLFNETYSVIGPEVADRNMRYSGNNLSCQSAISTVARSDRTACDRRVRRIPHLHGARGRSADLGRAHPGLHGAQHERARASPGRQGDESVPRLHPVRQHRIFRSASRPKARIAADRIAGPRGRSERGAQVYQANCASCHQADGQGQRNGVAGDAKGYRYPPLWGPDSFNNGAGMHRLDRVGELHSQQHAVRREL